MADPSRHIPRLLRGIARALSLPTRRRAWEVIRAAGTLESLGCRVTSAHAHGGMNAPPTIIIDPPPPEARIATHYYMLPGPRGPRTHACLLGRVRVQWTEAPATTPATTHAG